MFNLRLPAGLSRFSLWVLFSFVAPVAFAQSLTTEPIMDPAYGVKAFNISIPAGWKFQGTVLPGPECTRLPFPVFRAYSKDGLQEIRLQPVFSWSFHPTNKAFRPVPGCLGFTGSVSAADFLKKYEEMIASNGLHVIGPMPVGSVYQQRVANVAKNVTGGDPGIRGSADAAAVRVETVNGTFIIEQRLRVYVACRVSAGPIDPNGGSCSAHIDVERAPKGKLDALCALVDAHDLANTPFEMSWALKVQQTLTQRATRTRPTSPARSRPAMPCSKSSSTTSWPPRSAIMKRSWPSRSPASAVMRPPWPSRNPVSIAP